MVLATTTSCGGTETVWTFDTNTGPAPVTTFDGHHAGLHEALNDVRREVNALKDLMAINGEVSWWTRHRLRLYLRTR